LGGKGSSSKAREKKNLKGKKGAGPYRTERRTLTSPWTQKKRPAAKQREEKKKRVITLGGEKEEPKEGGCQGQGPVA